MEDTILASWTDRAVAPTLDKATGIFGLDQITGASVGLLIGPELRRAGNLLGDRA
jgi:hypothetical protein